MLHFFQRGNEAFAMEDYRRAIYHYNRAVELDHNSPDIFYNLGLAYYRVGAFRDAAQSYEKALLLDPNFSEAHLNLALAYDKLYQPDAAHRHYNRYRGLVAPRDSQAQSSPALAGSTVPVPAQAVIEQAKSNKAKATGRPAAARVKTQGKTPASNPYQGNTKWWMVDPDKANR